MYNRNIVEVVSRTNNGGVQLAASSSASELREQTRERSKQSLGFFLVSVLGVPVSEETCDKLQHLGLRRLFLLAVGIALWCRLRGAKQPIAPADHEAVRWLFPEVKDL
jgi:hypothetical protein